MAPTLRASAFCLLAAVGLEVCLAARRVELSLEEEEARTNEHAEEFRRLDAFALESYPKLCNAALVHEACEAFNQDEDGAAGVDVDRVMGVMSATRSSAEEMWRAMQEGAPDVAEELSCQDLCDRLVHYLRGHQWTLPPASDTGCYQDDEGVSRCDMDLSPEELGGPELHSGEDIPNFHAGEGRAELINSARRQLKQQHAQEQADDGIHYTADQLAGMLANVYRIYPELKNMDFEGDEDDLDVANGTQSIKVDGGDLPMSMRRKPKRGGWRAKVRKASAKAEAYLSTAIRKFMRKDAAKWTKMWFGEEAVDDKRDRKKILKVLNSVDLMISNVDYVYPGEDCESSTYAYVYPEADTCKKHQLKSHACTKNDRGQFIFYMCPLTMRSKLSVQIETITHEGSHHATAYTDDVDFEGGTAYGRSVCKRLAKKDPDLALENADNYCYFIQDITDKSKR